MAWRFFKNYIKVDREKIYLLIFGRKMITFESLREITKGFPGQQKKPEKTNFRFDCLKYKNVRLDCASRATQHNPI